MWMKVCNCIIQSSLLARILTVSHSAVSIVLVTWLGRFQRSKPGRSAPAINMVRWLWVWGGGGGGWGGWGGGGGGGGGWGGEACGLGGGERGGGGDEFRRLWLCTL